MKAPRTFFTLSIAGGLVVLLNAALAADDPHDFGNFNTFTGLNAGNHVMTGTANTGTGVKALSANAAGVSNTAAGVNALSGNETGSGNTATGVNTLLRNTRGNFNTATGEVALASNTKGNYNTASGVSALQNNDGFFNTAVGANALLRNTIGRFNIGLGFQAGYYATGDYNIDIGNTGRTGESNTIRIGAEHTRTFIAGIRGRAVGADAVNVVVDGAGALGTINSSRTGKDQITNMGTASSVLAQLRPVTFYYKSDQDPKGRTLQYGLIAEDVARVAPGLVARSANGEIESVYYQFLAPMLLNEYQKQQHTIEEQGKALDRQAVEIAELKSRVAHMTAMVSRLR